MCSPMRSAMCAAFTWCSTSPCSSVSACWPAPWPDRCRISCSRAISFTGSWKPCRWLRKPCSACSSARPCSCSSSSGSASCSAISCVISSARPISTCSACRAPAGRWWLRSNGSPRWAAVTARRRTGTISASASGSPFSSGARPIPPSSSATTARCGGASSPASSPSACSCSGCTGWTGNVWPAAMKSATPRRCSPRRCGSSPPTASGRWCSVISCRAGGWRARPWPPTSRRSSWPRTTPRSATTWPGCCSPPTTRRSATPAGPSPWPSPRPWPGSTATSSTPWPRPTGPTA